MSVHSSAIWLKNAVTREGIAEIVREAVAALKDVDFDTVAFRGMSGALIAPIVAHQLNKEIALVRKPKGEDYSHSYENFEGYLQSKRYVILDDFVSTGDTLAKIVTAMKESSIGQPKLAGVYTYYYNGATVGKGFHSTDSEAAADIDLFKKVREKIGWAEL